MAKYLIRLDDAAEFYDAEKWNSIEKLLDKYNIKPIVGVIPHCEDEMLCKYERDLHFWDKVKRWEAKGWIIAMHGYNHVMHASTGGLNPINAYSEFVGLPLKEQKSKVRNGYNLFLENDINPHLFFAPAHTFDENTLIALKSETEIRIISDTVASDIYSQGDFLFIPQQSGRCRSLPFKTVTFCLHPNIMDELDIYRLERFLRNNETFFADSAFVLSYKHRKYNIYDLIIKNCYFALRKIRNVI